MRTGPAAFTVFCVVTLSACQGDEPAFLPRPDGDPIPFGLVDELPSAILGEKRVLNVYLPPRYQTSTDTYPVIYLLDGAVNEDYHHVTGLVQFLTTYRQMPESIVIGIANTDRKRDLTHPTSVAEDRANAPTAGGSARFIRFLAEELQPHVERTYRTNGKRSIIGQSLAGLLATEVLLTRPALFDTYLIVSPSLWWSDGSLVASARDSLAGRPGLEAQVFLSIGTEHPALHAGMDRLRAAMEAAGKGVRWTYVHLPDETHATVLHRAVYRGLEFFHETPPSK